MPMNPLDRTLRFLYDSLRLAGATVMAIEFEHRGKRWRADTEDEAIRLRKKLEEDERIDLDEAEAAQELLYQQTKWTDARFHDLVKNLGPMQQLFVTALVLSPNQFLSADTARKRLRMPTLLSLAGIQSGLAKQIRAIGLESSDLYQIKISWEKGERTRSFKIDKGFQMVALDNEWPPEKLRKQLREVQE